MDYSTLLREARATAPAGALAKPSDGIAKRVRALAMGGALIGALAVPLALPRDALARSAPESFADLAERLSPSVVNISTTAKVEQQRGGGGGGGQGRPFEFQFPPGSPFEEFFKEFFERNQPRREGPRRRRVTSLGSGFVIDKSGLIVTNNHVVAEADEVTVTFSNGDKLEAKVLGKDQKTDLAVLKVEPEGELPAVSWGDSRTSRVGDWVVAIGNPFGLGGSVTAGIISARGRDINAGPYDDFIQTDASINRGNSGGPLFNLKGQVIGINTAIFSPSGGSVGIGFAIPASLAKGVVSQLAKYGKTRRGWLGVRIQTVTDEIAESLGLGDARGALVAGVTDDGPAKNSGIEQGDVILRFDGKEVPEMRALPRIVAETEIGKAVDVEVWRKGAKAKIKVTIAEMDDEAVQVARATPDTDDPKTDRNIETLGMTLSPLTDELRQKYELREGAEGIVVMSVNEEGAAADKDIRPGDVILEVDQQEVRRPSDVLDKVQAVKAANKKSVLLLLERGGDKRFVAVRLDQS